LRVEDIMTKRIVTVGFEDTLSTVKEIFDTVKFHHLLVVEDGELQGIVSDRDLLQGQSDLYIRPGTVAFLKIEQVNPLNLHSYIGWKSYLAGSSENSGG